ncbi:MAG: hypothetical protein IPL47_06050 [Phyllobacteriaceae bacterium]|nr:hypothetical protein [Phyllobacteriaceae bacterium]
MVVLTPAAARSEGVSEIVAAEAGSPEFAVAGRIAATMGLPVPTALSTADLDNDGFPEFIAFGDGGARILRLGADAWADISGGLLAGVTGLDDIAITPARFNGSPILEAGGRDLAFLDGVYRPLAEIAPAALDATAFTPACEKSDTIGFVLEENDTPAAEIPAFCGCLLDQWRLRAAPQTLFDVYVRELTGEFREEDRDERGEFDTLVALTDEALYACKTQRGWAAEAPYPYGSPMFTGKPAPPDVEAYIDTCRAQEWVSGYRKIASSDRALGFCGCTAGHLALNGMSADGFAMVAGLYSGELSENDVAERDPSAIRASDEASEACIQAMPYR